MASAQKPSIEKCPQLFRIDELFDNMVHFFKHQKTDNYAQVLSGTHMYPSSDTSGWHSFEPVPSLPKPSVPSEPSVASVSSEPAWDPMNARDEDDLIEELLMILSKAGLTPLAVQWDLADGKKWEEGSLVERICGVRMIIRSFAWWVLRQVVKSSSRHRSAACKVLLRKYFVLFAFCFASPKSLEVCRNSTAHRDCYMLCEWSLGLRFRSRSLKVSTAMCTIICCLQINRPGVGQEWWKVWELEAIQTEREQTQQVYYLQTLHQVQNA